MKNSPTTCQRFVDLSLQLSRQRFPDACIYHYMDDILLASPSAEKHQCIFLNTEIKEYGLHIAVDKLQEQEAFTYLGYIFQRNITKP